VDRIGVGLHRPGSAKSFASARRFLSGPEPRGHAEPPEMPCAARRVLKKNYSSGPLFSELLGSTVFIRPGAAGTRGTPRAALHQEAGAGAQGARADPRAALSREVGTEAAGTRGAPGAALRGPGAALSREVGTGAARTHGAPRVALRRDTRRPRSCPTPRGECCPRSCPEPVYCWLFLVISS
jgi:hypothetical protein